MYAFVTICSLLISFQAVFGNGKVNPDTVDSLDIPKYLGLWYQIAADQIVYSTFEKDAYCCTALYGDNGDISPFYNTLLKKIYNSSIFLIR